MYQNKDVELYAQSTERKTELDKMIAKSEY